MNIQVSASFPLDELHATWAQLTDHIDAFITAWEHGEAVPVLADFLPKDAPGQRRLALVELIKVDLHFRVHEKPPPRIEDYVERFPELRLGGIPIDLLIEEFHIRRRAGQDVRVEEYQERFPDRGGSLGRLFALASGPPPATEGFRPWAKPAEAGEKIDEFQVLRLLGKGAFAHVYLAWQPSMQRTVALKVSADRGTESQMLAQLDHPNIVRVFDQRVLPEQRTRLMYMSFVAGGTLAGVIEHMQKLPKEKWSGAEYVNAVEDATRANGIDVGPRVAVQEKLIGMTWPEFVAWIGARLASALDYAHSKSVLHRDVKPANILLSPHGEPQLADFNVGTASFKEPGPEAVFGGTMPYMAPEHLEALHPYLPKKADEIDHRSDIYELGMTLWQLMAGERPFPDEQFKGDLDLTIDALLESRRAGVPAKVLAALPVGHSAELVGVLGKCLAAEPNDRFASAGELARELELCQDPEALELLRPKPSGWRTWVRRWPVSWILAIGLAPNIITSIFNIHYNHAAVISARPESEPLFWRLVNIINAIFFPLALAAFIAAVRPVARAVRMRERGELVPSEALSAARIRCLRLGPIAGWVCVAAWVLAGVVWPVTLDVLGGAMPLDAHLHFLASLTICGMIAAVYPFFLVSLLAVRALLPALLRNGKPAASEGAEIQRLDRALARNLLLAAAVPLIGVAAMVTIDSQDRTSMLGLTIIGLVGCVLAYDIGRRLRADLAAITRIYFAKY